MDETDRSWLTAVRSGHPPGSFGHREHLRLAWLALEDAGTVDDATREVCACIRAVAATHGAPQKYNHTVTAAWVRIVDHLRTARGVRTFDELVDSTPWLFDKRLLLRHYSPQTLASEEARRHFVAPDLRPIPTPRDGAHD
jgi:hypothetical protein